MCKRHEHADVIIAWAEGKTVQQFFGGKWHDIKLEYPTFSQGWVYRVKPEPVEVITCNGVAITPMTEKPKVNILYFLAETASKNLYSELIWRDDDCDKRLFTRGLVHKTAESAREHALAMLNNKKELQDV